MNNFYHHLIYHQSNKEEEQFLGAICSDSDNWQILGSRRSLCELATGKYLPESELTIHTMIPDIIIDWPEGYQPYILMQGINQ